MAVGDGERKQKRGRIRDGTLETKMAHTQIFIILIITIKYIAFWVCPFLLESNAVAINNTILGIQRQHYCELN